MDEEMSQGPIAVVGAPAAETEEDSTITDALNDSSDTLQSSDVGDDTERISATRPATKKQRFSPLWVTANAKNLEEVRTKIANVTAEIAAKNVIANDLTQAARDRGVASKALTGLASKMTRLQNEEKDLEVRRVELEDLQKMQEEAEANQREHGKSEFTDEMTACLIQLRYWTFKPDFEGTNNTNLKCWENLRTEFNAWCIVKSIPHTFTAEQLIRKHKTELDFFTDMQRQCNTLTSSGTERSEEQKSTIMTKLWRPAFADFLKHDVQKKEFITPPLVLSGGKPIMANPAAKAAPLRIGGQAPKYRPDRAQSDPGADSSSSSGDQERRKYVRRTARTIIGQQAEADNLRQDARELARQKFFSEERLAENAAAEVRHANLLQTLKDIQQKPTGNDLDVEALWNKVIAIEDNVVNKLNKQKQTGTWLGLMRRREHLKGQLRAAGEHPSPPRETDAHLLRYAEEPLLTTVPMQQ